MILRDPVHGLVAFEREEERVVLSLLDTPEVQRLRRIRALGTTSLAFPGAEHSRFVHAIGAAHVMQAFLVRVRDLSESMTPVPRLRSLDRQAAMAAALLHDAGHGPLSHLFEQVFPACRPHEDWTSDIILDPGTSVNRVLREVSEELPGLVERLVHGEHPHDYLAHAVSGTFDVDRCDYLLRDSYMTGVRYGLYDLPWLLRSLRLSRSGTDSIQLAVDGSKGLPAVEGFFLARIFMYQQVYFHKASRAAEVMIRSMFTRFRELVQESSALRAQQKLLGPLACGESISTSSYLELDDRTIWNSVDEWCDGSDAILADLARRIRARRLFKTASLDDLDPTQVEDCVHRAADIARTHGMDPRYYLSLDVASVEAYVEPGESEDNLEVVYQHRSSRPLDRASFLIGRLRGEQLSRTRLVFPEELRLPIEQLLRQKVFS